MKKIKFILAAFLVTGLFSFTSAQKFKVISGSFEFMKEITMLNLEFDYSEMSVGKFKDEADYVAKKKMDYVLKLDFSKIYWIGVKLCMFLAPSLFCFWHFLAIFRLMRMDGVSNHARRGLQGKPTPSPVDWGVATVTSLGKSGLGFPTPVHLSNAVAHSHPIFEVLAATHLSNTEAPPSHALHTHTRGGLTFVPPPRTPFSRISVLLRQTTPLVDLGW